MIISFVLFSLGLVVGSFLNLVIDRTLREESILTPRSFCDFCHHSLAVLDLVPLVSFILLRGRCRYCRHRLAWRLVGVELTTGIVFGLVGFGGPASLPFPLVIFAAAILVGVGFSDLVNGLIPDTLVLPGIVILVLWSLFFGYWSRLIFACGLTLFFWLLYLLTKGKGLGLGDVKLVALVGLIFDPAAGILAVNLSLILAGGLSLLLLVLKKRRFGQTIPLGPFLSAGTLIFLILGK